MAPHLPEPPHLPPQAPKAPPNPGTWGHLPSGVHDPMRGPPALDGYAPAIQFVPRPRMLRQSLWAPVVLFAAGMALGTGALWRWVTPAVPSAASTLKPGAPGDPGAASASPEASGAPVPAPNSGTQAASLLFTADAPIGAPEIFWLDNPSRLVVDLMGVRPAAAAPVVAAHHPGVRRIRLGAHSDRTRYVIEMARAGRPEVLTRVEGRALAVTLRFVETDRVQTD